MAYVLSRMPLTTAAPLWLDHGPGLLARLAAGHRRVLCGCIIRFADTSEVGRLQAWATDPAAQGVDEGFAFVALARLAPLAAVNCLRAAGRRRLFLFEKSSMRELWLREPEATSRVLIEWLAAEPEAAWQLVSFFETGPDRLHGEPLRQLLRQFENDLRGWTGRNVNDVRAMSSRAEILAKLGRHPAALDEYPIWKNTPLDLELGRVLAEVAGQPEPRFRDDLDVVFELLVRIGGEGLKIAVTAWVQGADPLFQGWMEYVSLVDTPEVTAGLRRRADSLIRTESSPKQLPWDQSEALILLAARNDDAKIVETVLRWGEDAIFETLADIRTEGPPMKDADIQPALTALGLNEPLQNRINAAYALGLSARPDVASRLRALVETEAFNLKLMTAVLHALSMLDIKDVSLIPALRLFLRTKETAAPAARLLMPLDTPEAVAALGESLLAGEPTIAAHFPWDIQRHLLGRPEWRQRILAHIPGIMPSRPSGPPTSIIMKRPAASGTLSSTVASLNLNHGHLAFRRLPPFPRQPRNHRPAGARRGDPAEGGAGGGGVRL